MKAKNPKNLRKPLALYTLLTMAPFAKMKNSNELRDGWSKWFVSYYIDTISKYKFL